MKTAKITPFFRLLFSALPACNIHLWIWKYLKIIFKLITSVHSGLWNTSSFCGKLLTWTAHYTFPFQKEDTLRLLKIYIMFCLPAGANTYFFRLQLMDYIGDWRKFHTELVYFFITFLMTKKKLLRALLTCTFIRLLMNSFDLHSYSSKSRSRYTFRLLCCWCD